MTHGPHTVHKYLVVWDWPGHSFHIKPVHLKFGFSFSLYTSFYIQVKNGIVPLSRRRRERPLGCVSAGVYTCRSGLPEHQGLLQRQSLFPFSPDFPLSPYLLYLTHPQTHTHTHTLVQSTNFINTAKCEHDTPAHTRTQSRHIFNGYSKGATVLSQQISFQANKASLV